MIPYLDSQSQFPSTDNALLKPNGLLAAGAELSLKCLTNAYSNGIFPWYSEDEPILWWSPNPRTIFNLNEFKPSRSLKRFIKNSNLTVTLNCDFAAVIENCALPRSQQEETWITDDMKSAYINLHNNKLAHSVEVWQNTELVGGIYGVAIGKLFCGESMFSRINNGSKVALTYLVEHLKTEAFPIIDCQVENPHLNSLGAAQIDREAYLSIVQQTTKEFIPDEFWSKQRLATLTKTRSENCK